jgi:proteasome-associated ATPase
VATGDDSGHNCDPQDITAQISVLDEEIAVLRYRLQGSPNRPRTPDDRLREAEASLAEVIAQNEQLAATLRRARDQIIALKEEVRRLSQRSSPAD